MSDLSTQFDRIQAAERTYVAAVDLALSAIRVESGTLNTDEIVLLMFADPRSALEADRYWDLVDRHASPADAAAVRMSREAYQSARRRRAA